MQSLSILANIAVNLKSLLNQGNVSKLEKEIYSKKSVNDRELFEDYRIKLIEQKQVALFAELDEQIDHCDSVEQLQAIKDKLPTTSLGDYQIHRLEMSIDSRYWDLFDEGKIA